MNASPFDTIAAVSTPYGKGGVAVIRLSGDEAIAIACRVFRPAGGADGPVTGHPTSEGDLPSRMAVYGTIIHPLTGAVVDDGLCTVFRAPRSYTGEDTVEFSCHGGVLVTARVLEVCLAAGARQALPGEFTRRAFLGGKLDLERTEALGNLLEAGNDHQLALARGGMNGLLAARTQTIYDDLCGVLSNLEAGMDFPEEDLTEMTREELLAAINAARGDISALLATYRTGHAIAEGIPTVILGEPNVGKSALYNRLLGREAAIVTHIAGTTRDVLTDTVSLGRVTLRLSDTAGLRDTDDPVEQIGVERARKAAADAELVLLLRDGTTPEDEAATAAYETLRRDLLTAGKQVICVYTKGDLVAAPHDREPDTVCPQVCLSARTGEGMDTLTAAVEQMYIDKDLHMGEDAVLFSARQAAALGTCHTHLGEAVANLQADVPYDICADDIRAALIALGSLCGRDTSEDVLTQIFARFCVGK